MIDNSSHFEGLKFVRPTSQISPRFRSLLCAGALEDDLEDVDSEGLSKMMTAANDRKWSVKPIRTQSAVSPDFWKLSALFVLLEIKRMQCASMCDSAQPTECMSVLHVFTLFYIPLLSDNKTERFVNSNV